MLLNKVLTTVTSPVGTTVGSIRARMAVCQCGTISGNIVVAADVIASECVPPVVQVSGKCFVSLGLYCWNACTANPYSIAAGTPVLTSIVTD